MKLPGLIDVHVHVREPGATHKEDWSSATAAALAGGFTTILAMPNTQPPVTDAETLGLALDAARAKARCDYAQYLGAGEGNVASAAALAPRTAGLKLYLDQTYGPLRLDDLTLWREHLARWPPDRPVAVHAEGRTLVAAIAVAALEQRPVHLCHVSLREEIVLIARAKERGWPVTCEVAPHHLLLTQEDGARLGPGRSEVRPRLATARDRDALWEHLDAIDCFATDHAPHTPAEKDGERPPPGFPGLETALALLLGAVHDGRLDLEGLVARLHTNPRRIFGLPTQPATWIEVDPDEPWTVPAAPPFSRAGWTPFAGRALRGRVRRVVLRGRVAFEDGAVLAPPGSGRDLRAADDGAETTGTRPRPPQPREIEP
jgi:carbamoyl-phosphate synthase/aspartate carbamoyltransferase/dihydroorotase